MLANSWTVSRATGEAALHQPLTPDEAVSTAGERAVLEAFLDHYRDEVVRTVKGITEEDARRRLVPSLTTLGGLVKHLQWVEVGWFHQLLGARSGDNRRPHERETEFRMDPGDTVDSLIEDYRCACATSRAFAAGHDLNDRVPHQHLGEVTLRWIYVHLIEETARHAGHLDILREQIDAEHG